MVDEIVRVRKEIGLDERLARPMGENIKELAKELKDKDRLRILRNCAYITKS